MAELPPDVHHQSVVTTMAKKYNLPGIFYLDLWPASPGQVIVIDPDVAQYMTVTKNYPKHEAEQWFCMVAAKHSQTQSDTLPVDPLIGKGNIVTVEGPQWKYLHKMLSPAFSIQHISNMRPAVSTQTCIVLQLAKGRADC